MYYTLVESKETEQKFVFTVDIKLDKEYINAVIANADITETANTVKDAENNKCIETIKPYFDEIVDDISLKNMK